MQTATTTQARAFARTRVVTKSATDANDGALTFEDEDCVDLCDLGDDLTAPVSPQQPQQEQQQQQQLTDQEQQLIEQEQELQAEKQRIRLEMHWELEENKEECDVQDEATCSDTCSECRGVGHTTCQFCMGAKLISLGGGNDVSCPVCDEQGRQVCQKCKGSGRVAPWTELSDFNPQL